MFSSRNHKGNMFSLTSCLKKRFYPENDSNIKSFSKLYSDDRNCK